MTWRALVLVLVLQTPCHSSPARTQSTNLYLTSCDAEGWSWFRLITFCFLFRRLAFCWGGRLGWSSHPALLHAPTAGDRWRTGWTGWTGRTGLHPQSGGSLLLSRSQGCRWYPLQGLWSGLIITEYTHLSVCVCVLYLLTLCFTLLANTQITYYI